MAMDHLITEKIIGAAIEVHRQLGPGLLESSYEKCLALEFELRKIIFERQKVCPTIKFMIAARREASIFFRVAKKLNSVLPLCSLCLCG